ncbi:MAG: hypothetical protein NVS4B5_13360 [Vulcanimicrobiaceae bacterium]
MPDFDLNLGRVRPVYLKEAVPVVPALDVAISLAFYEEKLAFAEIFRGGDPPVYAGMQRDGVRFHLFECADKRIADWSAFRIYVRGIAELYAASRTARIVHPNGALGETPWRTTESTIIDPSGVAVTFVEPKPTDER